MAQTVTLTLPDTLYEPIQRIAHATDQPMEIVVLAALQASLPALDGLSEDQVQELIGLEELDDEALRQVLLEIAPIDQQHELEDLLDRHQSSGLEEAEREQLARLQQAADKIMLRKARAARQ